MRSSYFIIDTANMKTEQYLCSTGTQTTARTSNTGKTIIKVPEFDLTDGTDQFFGQTELSYRQALNEMQKAEWQ